MVNTDKIQDRHFADQPNKLLTPESFPNFGTVACILLFFFLLLSHSVNYSSITHIALSFSCYDMGAHCPMVELDNAIQFSKMPGSFKGVRVPVA